MGPMLMGPCSCLRTVLGCCSGGGETKGLSPHTAQGVASRRGEMTREGRVSVGGHFYIPSGNRSHPPTLRCPGSVGVRAAGSLPWMIFASAPLPGAGAWAGTGTGHGTGAARVVRKAGACGTDRWPACGGGRVGGCGACPEWGRCPHPKEAEEESHPKAPLWRPVLPSCVRKRY